MNLRAIALRILKGFALALLVASLFGVLVQWLWNHLCPGIFHLPPLTFLESVGLIVLARLLVGHHGGGPHWGGPHPFRRGPWPMAENDPRRDPRNWGRYGQWWQSEGHGHFEAWLRKTPSNPAAPHPGATPPE